ncbi:MAG: SpoIIE family protein phosphatase [Rhodothermales bacterium]
MADRSIPTSRTPRETRWSGWGQPFETRIRRILLWAAAGFFYLVTAAYHALTALVKIPADTATDLIYGASVAICYGLFVLIIARYYNRQRLGVLRVFWGGTLAGGILFGALTFLPPLSNVGRYDELTGLPENLGTVLKIVLVSPLMAGFAISTLFRFRELVLFKRTKRSVRQWYLMIGSMAAASIAMWGAKPDQGINVFAGIFLGISIVLMVANSFRLSRIVYLSLKEKLVTIGLSIVMIVVLTLGVATTNTGLFPGRSYPFLWTYSPSLNLFVLQCVIFGIMYSVTACLSLLFHLPTTSEFQQKAGELAAIHSVVKLTGEVMNKEMLISTIVGSPIEAAVGDAAWLALTDPRTGSLRPRVIGTRNITPGQVQDLFDTDALYDEALSRRAPVLLNQATTDHRVKARPGDGMSSLLVVPLLARKEVLGALFVTKQVSQGFEPDDIETISTFADQAALALDNARLFEEQIDKERLARELVIAREVQRKLLPQALPSVEGMTVAASSVSAQEVGGDYYDFVEVGPDRWAFIVGDVSGKGTSAAFYMAELKGVFRALSRLTPSPAKFLDHANHALAHSMEKNVFISVVYGILDLEKKQFTLARAGHCPIAMVNGSGEARFLRTEGLGLGLDRGVLFASVLEEETITLRRGDVFVLYTDGVVESRSESGEEFGYDRLIGAVRKHHDKPVKEIHSALLADLNRFLGRADYDDDMTLVVLRWDGRPSAGATDHATEVASEAYVPATKERQA